MKLFRKWFRSRVEKGVEFWGAPLSASGKVVTAESAKTIAAVHACIKVLAETYASVPLIMYRRTAGDGRERATTHPLYFLLHDEPNPFQTSYEWREMTAGHCLLRGNAYSQIQIDGSGNITALMPLHPDRVFPVLLNGTDLIYRYTPRDGQMITFAADEILHIKCMADDMIVGQNPIHYHRDVFGRALAEHEYGSKYFANNARPSGVLEHPGEMGEEEQKTFRRGWEQAFSGSQNAFRIAILEEGMKWQQLQVNNNDAQWIESCRLTVHDICRIFGVPPHLIGEMERATFSNIEQKGQDFVTYTMHPHFVRSEKRFSKSLLLPREKKKYYFEFLVDGLMRGDFVSRQNGYKVGHEGGWLSVNDIRRMENLNVIADGDIYMLPMNFVPASMFESTALSRVQSQMKTAKEKPDPTQTDPADDPTEG